MKKSLADAQRTFTTYRRGVWFGGNYGSDILGGRFDLWRIDIVDFVTKEGRRDGFMDSEAKWYVAHTYSGYENKVKAALRQR